MCRSDIFPRLAKGGSGGVGTARLLAPPSRCQGGLSSVCNASDNPVSSPTPPITLLPVPLPIATAAMGSGFFWSNCNSDVSRRGGGGPRTPPDAAQASPRSFPLFSRSAPSEASYDVISSSPPHFHSG